MADPRTDRLARLLVHYSTRVKPGDRAFIVAEPLAMPLIRALFEHVIEAGGYPHLLIVDPSLEEIILKKGSEEQIDFAPTFLKLAYEEFEVRYAIHAKSNTRALTGVDKERFARRRRTMQPILQTQMERGAKGDLRWLTTLFPTEAYAQDAEMSLTEYQDFVYQACHVDDPDLDPVAYWQGVKDELAEVAAALSKGDRIEVRGPNCDLRLSIKGRTFVGCHGTHNMPDGEVFTGPVEDSIEGWVRFTYPVIWKGNMAEGVELTFKQGRVVEAKAEKNQEFIDRIIDTDPGSRYLGEFAFGTNFGIDRFTGNILFDEKIGGSFHIALGAGYPETGSKNQSAIHLDMVCDMRQDAEALMDGDVFYKNGEFQL
jgi:aminopeptidase